ncbi:MAG: TonB-dependent receptor [Odoribacteraceae bacterium]|jgi:iron complex outermembrane receptor protein|nr:TonB-dependent receptor [Odoribacteraceae bacterium]
MHAYLIPLAWCALLVVSPATASERDSLARETTGDTIASIRLEEVVITGRNYPGATRHASPLPVEITGKGFTREDFTGNFARALGRVPGVHSMDIGSGFSKPVIRGMGFNRVVVLENGVKQEGQQWGADHGLEIDAFNAESVAVHKGPASLLHGSDATGGVIEITRRPPPVDNRVVGELVLLARAMNGTVGGSAMIGMKRGAWYAKLRYTEQHFGDYRVPVDTVIYLTRRLPVAGRALKNTAGMERDVAGHVEYRLGAYHAWLTASNAYQKVGFFPGAHGVPDPARLEDDGNSRDTGLPYSSVNHLKVTTRQERGWERVSLRWDAGYQRNYREERSRFHTHYGTMSPPERSPDLELAFSLDTYSSSLRVTRDNGREWEQVTGWDMQVQRNRVAGYSFLLPGYDRLSTGLFGLVTYRPDTRLSISGGARYDRGRVEVFPYRDEHLEIYLREQGYSETEIARYRWRAYAVRRDFDDFSFSLGAVLDLDDTHLLKANIGKGFRLPGANELAANGVHHGTFRHEQGDPSLLPERGWQVDLSYSYRGGAWSLSASPFLAFFGNYIYLKPTGEWSALPHAGQIYRYAGARSLFAGGELSLGIDLPLGFSYRLSGEYVYSRNLDDRSPLSFSPPTQARNTIAWEKSGFRLHAEWQHIATQRRTAKNEDPTNGADLLHAGVTGAFSAGNSNVEITLALENALDKRYYNHLSFYRKIELPEPGRDLRVVIRIPFK